MVRKRAPVLALVVLSGHLGGKYSAIQNNINICTLHVESDSPTVFFSMCVLLPSKRDLR